jgi:hypothetical protein
VKTLIAYALVVIGVTQLLGILVGTVIDLPIAMLLPHGPVKMRIVPLLEFFNGAAALAAALALFWLLSVSISLILPIIIGAWLTVYFFSFCRRFSQDQPPLANTSMDWNGRFLIKSSIKLAASESPIRVPQTRSAFHQRAQRSVFRRRAVRQ